MPIEFRNTEDLSLLGQIPIDTKMEKIAFNPSGQLLVVQIGNDLVFYDVSGEEFYKQRSLDEIVRLENPTPTSSQFWYSIKFSTDGRFIMTGYGDDIGTDAIEPNYLVIWGVCA